MFRNKIFFILIISFFSINLFASQPKWPHETIKDLPFDNTITFGKLENGLRYVIKNNTTPKDRISLMLDVQVGSIHEKNNERGIAHFLEHMVFNGSKHFKPDELVKFFQRIGMSFGPDANAHTGFNETVYKILLPDNTEKLLNEGLTVLRDFADGALLLEEEVKKERGIILSEMIARDSFKYRTQVAEIGFSYKGTNLAKRFPIGSKEVLLKADSKLLKNFYKKWYVPSNMILVVVGDIKDLNVEQYIENIFSSMNYRESNINDTVLEKIKRKKSEAFYHYEKEAGKTEISIGITSNLENYKDGVIYRTNLISETIASIIMNLRIQSIMEKGNIPFTDAYFYTGDFLNRYKYSFLSLDTNPERWKETLKFGRKLIDQMFEYGFTEKEFETAKKIFLSGLKSAAESQDTRKSDSIASSVINDLNSRKAILSPAQKYEVYKKIVGGLDNKIILQHLKEIWKNRPRLILATGNLKLDNQPEILIFNEYKKLDNMTVEPFGEEKSYTFPYLFPSKESVKVLKETYDSKVKIKTIILENNINIHLKKTDFEKNKIKISVSMGYGKFYLNDNLRGLPEISKYVVNESGLGKIPLGNLYRELADKNIDVNLNINTDDFEIEGSSDKEHSETLIQLLYHEIKDPGFSETVRKKYLEHLKQQEQTLRHTVNGQYVLNVEKFLRGNDRRFGMPTYKEQSKFALNDIKNWIMKNFQQSPVEVNVIGDFDETLVANLLKKYFGNLSHRPDFKKIQYTQKLNFPVKTKKILEFDSKIEKSLITFNYLTTDRSNIHKTRVLGLLSELVNERLRVVIREKLGESYSPFAYNSSSELFKDYGVLKIFVYAKKDDIDKIEHYLLEMIEDLKKGGISDDEFERIKKPLLTQIKDQIKTNNYWINSVMTNMSRYPEKVNWAKTILEDYKRITKAEVLAAAKEYLNNDRLSIIIIKPKNNK